MNFLILSLFAFLAASFCAWAGRGEKKILFSCVGVLAASVIGLLPAIGVLTGGLPLADGWKSEIPGLVLAFGIDGLTALFLTVIFFLSIVVAIYSIGYLKGQAPLQKYSPFFPLLVGAMAAVVTARDGFLFLICWEVMSLASFFLVTVEHSSREVRHAGWVYLISTHLGTAFLAVFFILLQNKAGSFLFADFAGLPLSTPLAGFLFVLTVIGFGTKAGLFPLHVWLPHAHPAAASPISALMSGVMIMTGFYGLLRALTFLGNPEPWWGGVLLIMGIFSAVFGILWAFLQDDIKRFLAYSSVENSGIIAIAIGLGILGQALENPAIAALGFAGGLLHFVNHALFKGLLFLSAGGIIHSAHTRAMGRLGGLLQKMPVTGGTFLVASLGACAFPVFNGFAGEWLIYLGLFRGGQSFGHFPLFLSVAGIVAMAFAGGLALAAFSKTFGLVFLGNARSKNAEAAHEIPWLMRLPLVILAFGCLAIGS
ncbi:MAG: proton-conducting transporter membrane subunit, partial [Deltaproteobacteria bacterium]|nr:proton-conducting transporter membrane subunit [Deltaproteobacteria bacterium]